MKIRLVLDTLIVNRLGHDVGVVSPNEKHHVFLSINNNQKYLIFDENNRAQEFDTDDLKQATPIPDTDIREFRIERLQFKIDKLQHDLDCLRRGD